MKFKFAFGGSGLSQVLSFFIFLWSLWIHQSLTETWGHVFPFGLFSRFLLKGLSFIYHVVFMRRLYLLTWCYPFSINVLTTSTIFVWWKCFPFRLYVFPLSLLSSVANISSKFSVGFNAWLYSPCSNHYTSVEHRSKCNVIEVLKDPYETKYDLIYILIVFSKPHILITILGK